MEEKTEKPKSPTEYKSHAEETVGGGVSISQTVSVTGLDSCPQDGDCREGNRELQSVFERSSAFHVLRKTRHMNRETE